MTAVCGAIFRWIYLLAAMAVATALPLGALQAADKFTGLDPASPQPKDGDLAAGLSVDYYFEFFQDIQELIEWTEVFKGEPGEPLLTLDNHVGQGDVLTSGRSNGVGAWIKGFIRFEKGLYDLQVNSNDGVRVTIGGQQIYEDPFIHADRMSDPLPVEITEAGWYPMEILYFEKKNTSTLQLFWRVPDSQEFAIVPGSALAHEK